MRNLTLVLAGALALGMCAGIAPARADDHGPDRDRRPEPRREEHRPPDRRAENWRYYAPPPAYAAPPAYYTPPPYVYDPGVTFGLTIR